MRKRIEVIPILTLIACLAAVDVGAQGIESGPQAPPTATPEPTEAETDPQVVPEFFAGVEVHGLLQGWFRDESTANPSAFSVRRAEVAFAGAISPLVTWQIMVDVSKSLALQHTYSSVGAEEVITNTSVDQGSRVLQDAFISVELPNGMHVKVGQFHVPLSREGLQGSGGLETVERALFAADHGRGGFYGDVRDVGISASGSLGLALEYVGGVFNGPGAGYTDGGEGFAGRVAVRPSKQLGLRLGASGAYAESPQRARYGADVQLDRGPLVIRSEIMAGEDGPLRRLGFYGLAAVQLSEALQAVVRFDSWDPDTGAEKDRQDVTERNFTAGLNFFLLDDALKVQANYVRKWFVSDLAPGKNVLWFNFQTSW